ncbi:MAG: hypothetical protein LKJ88_00800 [Bacilli bacterium]|jgi:hypothetical protein|nr:hypothetical protein [Bacilli bacterium]
MEDPSLNNANAEFVPSLEKEARFSFKDKTIIWVSLIVGVSLFVLFFTPWLDAVAALPGKDEAGNDIVVRTDHYYSMAVLLFESRYFFFMDFIFPLCCLLLLICASEALFKKPYEKKYQRLKNVTTMLLFPTILAFLVSLVLSFASMPCY